jgi:hypothetical protein
MSEWTTSVAVITRYPPDPIHQRFIISNNTPVEIIKMKFTSATVAFVLVTVGGVAAFSGAPAKGKLKSKSS